MIRKTLAHLTIGLLLASAASATAHWQSVSIRVAPNDVPKLIAATDNFMQSETGKAMPGTLSLMAAVIDGGDPATHRFVSSMESMADREKWEATLEGDDHWQEFLDAISKYAELGATTRMAFVKSWGETEPGDVVWELHAISAHDPIAYVEALETLMNTKTGQNFPGTLWLSQITAAGLTPITHVVTVGFASAAEAEAWNESMVATSDWAAFQEAGREASESHGTFVLRRLRIWGVPLR